MKTRLVPSQADAFIGTVIETGSIATLAAVVDVGATSKRFTLGWEPGLWRWGCTDVDVALALALATGS